MYRKDRVYIGFSNICGFKHPLGVLEQGGDSLNTLKIIDLMKSFIFCKICLFILHCVGGYIPLPIISDTLSALNGERCLSVY